MSESQIVIKEASSPFILRALYFVFVGWWLTGVWINVAWAANATVIGLPLGLWMLNRVPAVLTLKPVGRATVARLEGDELVAVRTVGVPQRSWIVRLLYFLVIGWWFSLLWANAAWFLCAIIIGLPLGIAMFNRLPAVTTLMRTG